MAFTKIMEQIEMSLNIEEERREFEAALMGYKGQVWSTGNMQLAFDMWLLAKRAAVGSAEPVAYRRFLKTPKDGGYWVFGERRYGVTGEEPLFPAPPAPVSAEPVNAGLIEGLKRAIQAANLALFVIRKHDVMPNSSWQSGFNSDVAAAKAALDSANESGSPTADAKDSERLDWLETMVVNVRGELRYGSRDVFWSSPEDLEDAKGPSDIRAQIDAAIAAKGAAK